MAEYIKREAALNICQKEYEDCLKMHDYCGDSVAWNIGGAIKGLPAADVAPVVHGKWYHTGEVEWSCTNCGNVIATKDSWECPTKQYCDECGARMDGGKEDAAD